MSFDDIHKGWHSRGYLPHFDCPGTIQSITFHLADSIPAERLRSWKEELSFADSASTVSASRAELRRKIEKFADAGHGACWLRRPDVGSIVENALLHFDGVRYHLLAWCVMPNHVHVLIDIVHGWPLRSLVHSRKSYTSKQANRILARNGEFWIEDYHDRYIRNEQHLANALSYIENNPVAAGLVKRAEDWMFSSARKR